MSVNSLSSSAVEFSPPPVATGGQLGNSAADVDRRGSNESPRAVSATAKAVTQAAENAQVLRFDADKQAQNVNSGNTDELQASREKEAKSDEQELTKALEVTNQLSSIQARKLQFTSTQEGGQTIIKVVDKENDEVIRQIPSEDFVKLAQKISDLTQQLDSAQGLLFESQV